MEMTLLVMAAGMGSRFGGLKQVEPMGEQQATLLEFSVFDAIRAGFTRAVFVIREEMEALFKTKITSKFGHKIKCEFAYQRMDDLPIFLKHLIERKKPWGTGHAVWCARSLVNTPFVAINADDYYGSEAYVKMATFFRENLSDSLSAIVAYPLENTLSDFGGVSRSICEMDDLNKLRSLEEYTSIRRLSSPTGEIIAEGRDNKRIHFSGKELSSLNFWGFSPSLFDLLGKEMELFLDKNQEVSSAEFYLPLAISSLIKQNKLTVNVLQSSQSWFGVTYPEDKPLVESLLNKLTSNGLYPKTLWS